MQRGKSRAERERSERYRKESMNLSGQQVLDAKTVNVVPLFGKITHEVEVRADPLSELLTEAMMEDTVMTTIEVKPRKIVSENHFPEQSLFTLDEQLRSLRSSIGRIRFYLDEIEDILPAKNR